MQVEFICVRHDGCSVESGRAVHILVINSGSSSIKFSIFEGSQDAGHASGTSARPPWPRVLFAGEITGIGGAKPGFTFRDAKGRELSPGAPKEDSRKDPVTLLEGAVCG